MNGCLQINSQKWNLCGYNGLKLFLPRQHQDGSIYFQADWSFVPPEVEVANVPPMRPGCGFASSGSCPACATGATWKIFSWLRRTD